MLNSRDPPQPWMAKFQAKGPLWFGLPKPGILICPVGWNIKVEVKM